MHRIARVSLAALLALAACSRERSATAPSLAPDDVSGVWAGTDGRVALEVDVPGASLDSPGRVIFRAGSERVALPLDDMQVRGDSCTISYHYDMTSTWEYRGAFVSANRIEGRIVRGPYHGTALALDRAP